MRFHENGDLDGASLNYQVARGNPWWPGDIVEFDDETGVGKVAMSYAETRDELMVSKPMQLAYPKAVRDKIP